MTAYAIDMLEGLEDAPELLGGEQTRELLLNGAGDWEQCSWGGCALVYDADIAHALCTPSARPRNFGARDAASAAPTLPRSD